MGAYEALAASYDRLTNDVDYGATVAFYREILAQEGLRPRTAVDLACGTGTVSILLAQQGLRVIGVDMSEEMLTVAQQKAGDMDNPPCVPAPAKAGFAPGCGPGGVRAGQSGLHHRPK